MDEKTAEKNLIFFPNREILYTPEDFGVEYEEDIFLAEDGVKLCGWMVRSKVQPVSVRGSANSSGDQSTNPSPPVLLYFHGNGENIGDCAEHISLLSKFGISSFVVDYRGYGKSEGEPSEIGCYRDAISSYRHLVETRKIDEDDLFLFGRSLGGAVAVELATYVRFPAIILEGTFTSFGDLLAPYYPKDAEMLKHKLNSIEKISRIYCPKLFIHGSMDVLVPYENARALFNSAVEPKEFYTVESAGHNNIYAIGGEAYFSKIRDFIYSHHRKW